MPRGILPLCGHPARRCWRSPTWRATGSDERPLLTVRRSWTGSRAEVVLARGGAYELHGSAWRQDFAVRGPAGAVVEAVAVQIWRMVRRGDAAAAAAV